MPTKPNLATTIKVSFAFRSFIKKRGQKGETYEDVLKRLLKWRAV